MVQYNYLFKYIIIGDTNVGKSCIMLKYIDGKYKDYNDPTIGVEFGSKTISHQGKTIKFQIWDTAGQESFRSITRSYFRGSIGALLVFDVTNRESFNNANSWLKEVMNNTSNNIGILLIGNKVDKDKREVSYAEAKEFSDKYNIEYIECSAKTDLNINQAFLLLTNIILRKIDEGIINPETEMGIKVGTINKVNEPKKEEGCC